MTRTFTPTEAVERYLKERAPDVSDSTLYNHKSALRHLNRFCDDEGIDNINDIDAFLISDFRLQRQDEVSDVTVYNNLCAVRVFIRWCEGRGLINQDIAENMILPDIGDAARSETISPEEVEQLLTYLEQYEYATLNHALFALLWNTGMRLGSARALNVADVNTEKNTSVSSTDQTRTHPSKMEPAASGT